MGTSVVGARSPEEEPLSGVISSAGHDTILMRLGSLHAEPCAHRPVLRDSNLISLASGFA